VKKQEKKLREIEALVAEARKNFTYCLDTTGELCDGEPYEVDGSKEEAESEAIGNLYDVKLLIDEILKSYGAE
jgi:hypothetical protein